MNRKLQANKMSDPSGVLFLCLVDNNDSLSRLGESCNRVEEKLDFVMPSRMFEALNPCSSRCRYILPVYIDLLL